MSKSNGVFASGSRVGKYTPSLSLRGFGGGRDGDDYFARSDVVRMRKNPWILQGLRMLRAPVLTAKWKVQAADTRVQAFVDESLKRFFRQDAGKALSMLEWGSSGGEAVARLDPEGLWQWDHLKDMHLNDIRPLELGGELWGVAVVSGAEKQRGALNLKLPAALWFANEAEFGSYYGRPRLAGSWEAWKEMEGKHGAREIRRTWMMRCAFRGGMMRYPDGSTLTDGGEVDNQEIAMEIVEKAETGFVQALPSVLWPETNIQKWEYIEPAAVPQPQGLMEYIDALGHEIWFGLGIPPEVLEANDTGSGYSGRKVPFEAFLKSEDAIVDCLIQTFDKQWLRWAVAVNFGSRARYKIEPVSLVPEPPPQPGAPGTPAPPSAMPGQQDTEGAPPMPGGGGPPDAPPPQPPGGQPMPAAQQLAGPVKLARDASGHEHAADGKFGHGGSAAAPARQGKLARAKAAIGRVFGFLDRATDVPGAKQAKQAIGGALKAVKATQGKLYGVMERRYGPKAAKAIFLAAQATGSNPALFPLWFVAIPGSTLLAQIPLMGVAEGLKQGRRLVKATVGLSHDGDEELSPEKVQQLARALLKRLARAAADALEPHKGVLTQALEGIDKAQLSQEVRLGAAHAPRGGVGVGGKYYDGGEFIPSEVMEKATEEERRQVIHGEGRRPHRKPNQPNEVIPDAGRPQMSEAEAASVMYYTAGRYDLLNKPLRYGGEMTPQAKYAHEHIQAAFAKVKSFERPVAVVRGMDLNNLKAFVREAKSAMESGGIMTFKGYVSTTTASEVDTDFDGNVVLKIAAFHGLDAMPYSDNPEERELLLNHGSQFRVNGISKKGHRYIVELEQITTESSRVE